MYIPKAFREDDLNTLYLPDDYLQKMMRGIVGFEIEITRLEGKFKLSQNRTETERENVIAALLESTVMLAVAELMKRVD